MATAAGHTQPTPELVFDTLNAYQRTAALKAAIELDVFTAIGEGTDTAAALAKRCQAAERGMRILCDYLVIIGFLTKQGQRYGLTPDTAVFLDRRSPVCIASAADFLTSFEGVARFRDLTAAVRKGGTTMPGDGTVEADNPIWIEFARSMAPLQIPASEAIAGILNARAGEKWKVLDIAAGHGLFGIALGKHNPNAEIYALDWPRVLEVAEQNAAKAGVLSRYHKLAGSAFELDYGKDYDIVLLTNILHHFDPVMNEMMLRRVRAALAPGGRAVTLEFVPNDDRVTPPRAAAFSLIMLASTPDGDTYTFREFEQMFHAAGFSSSEQMPLPNGFQTVIISRK